MDFTIQFIDEYNHCLPQQIPMAKLTNHPAFIAHTNAYYMLEKFIALPTSDERASAIGSKYLLEVSTNIMDAYEGYSKLLKKKFVNSNEDVVKVIRTNLAHSAYMIGMLQHNIDVMDKVAKGNFSDAYTACLISANYIHRALPVVRAAREAYGKVIENLMALSNQLPSHQVGIINQKHKALPSFKTHNSLKNQYDELRMVDRPRPIDVWPQVKTVSVRCSKKNTSHVSPFSQLPKRSYTQSSRSMSTMAERIALTTMRTIAR